MTKYAKLLKEVKHEKILGGISLDLFEIIAKKSGMTIGEMTLKYKEKYPNTRRSRNELAKRVSDLSRWRAVKVVGRTVCPVSGAVASQYALTGETPIKEKKLGSNVVSINPVRDLIIPDEVEAPVVVRERGITSPDHNAHLTVLYAVASKCRMILGFKWVLFPSYKRQTQDLLNAVQYAISELERMK